MKNPYIFWTVFALVFVAGFFIGNTAWAKNLFRGSKGNETTPPPPAEGSDCMLPDGSKGKIQNGQCVGGRPPVDTSVERTANGNGSGAKQRMCDWLDYAAYQACLRLGHSNCGTWLSGCVQGSARTTAAPAGITAQEVNRLCTERGIPADVCQEVIKGLNSGNASTQRSAASGAPAVILIPYSADCRVKYSSKTPYSYAGCSYVFEKNTVQAGVQYCQMRKVSCP